MRRERVGEGMPYSVIESRARGLYKGRGEIGGRSVASSAPAETRARARAAYEQAYTRAYNAALGDPLASPLSAGCKCCPCCKLCCRPTGESEFTHMEMWVVNCSTGNMRTEEGLRGPNNCECVIRVKLTTDRICGMSEYNGQVGGPGFDSPNKEECESQRTDQNCWIVCSGKTADTGVNYNFPRSKPDPGNIKELILIDKHPLCNCNPAQCGGRQKCEACKKAADGVYKELKGGIFKRKPSTRYKKALKKLVCKPLALCLC